MSEVLLAVGLGAVSAASLPLGAVTARLWQPTDRVLGVLTAFGAGALLAAVTVGIVAPLVEAGRLAGLVLGAVLGGITFAALNRAVNARGGFLRKVSTTLVHAQQRERRRRRRLLAGLERVDLFDGLPDRELDLLADAARVTTYAHHRVIYRRGDPAETLYVIVRGDVALEHHEGVTALTPHQVFGFRSFLAGAVHGSSALAASDPTEALEIDRDHFVSALVRAPTLRDRLEGYLQGDDVLAYLRDDHGLAPAELDDWLARVRADRGHGTVRARDAPHPREDFVARAAAVRRLPVFAGLPTAELDLIGQRLLRTRHRQGHVFFAPGDTPDRLYVVEEGSVALAPAPVREAEALGPGDAFGAMSFFTGAPHVGTAVAASEVTVWVLRRSDLEELLRALPRFRAAVHGFLQRVDVRRYLQEQQGVAAPRAEAWVRAAVRSIDAARPAPEVRTDQALRAAPLAIWLGLMLDGIPESFVIGAEATGVVGASLIAGLFLSNYPEALSSSVGMHEQGTGWGRILLLWSSLVVAAAVGAGIGAVVFAEASPLVSAGVRGVAAGAMLTVISETMLPEAFARSGSASGLAALAGFLVALLLGA